MKRPVLPGTVALILSCAGSLTAQDISKASRHFDYGSSPGEAVVAKGFATGAPIQPMVGISPASFATDQPWYLVQDPGSLGYSTTPNVTRPWSLDSQLRKNAAPFLKSPLGASRSGSGMSALAPAKQLNFALSLLAAMYGVETPSDTTPTGSLEYSLKIRQRIHDDPSKVLEIVTEEVTANPDRVCEIVKAAIKATDNDPEKVPSIVEAAVTVKPESMRLAAQCAVAAVPESLDAVQAVLSKLDPAAGDIGGSKDAKSSSKDAKDAKGFEVAAPPPPPNPLDLPPPNPPLPPIPPIPPPPLATETSFGR